jgi:biotin operon repressor
MSVQIINQIYADQKTFTPTQKYILLSLARFCRPGDNRCYRSLNELAQDTMFTRRCVMRNLKQLREMGVLIPVESQKYSFQAISTVYRINLNLINGGERSSFDRERKSPPIKKKPHEGREPNPPHSVAIDYIYINKQKIKNNENSQAIQKDEKLDAMFDEWWNAYPRKQNKMRTFEAFCRAIKKTDYAILLRKAIAYGKYRDKATKNKPEQVFYTKMPYNWLEQCLWEDHYGTYERQEIPKATTANHQFKECSPYVPFKPTETERVRPTQEAMDWMSRLMKASKLSEEEYLKVKKGYDDYCKQTQEAA